jgi:tripartite-type tricarboxylate transporter receptor subunit TctC
MSLAQFNNYEHLIRAGKLRILFHAEEAKVAEIPDVPSIYDLAATDEQRQLMRFVFSSVEFGRPYVLPPDVPPSRVAIMREAFADTAKDAELIGEAAKLKLDMSYHTPAQLERLVANLYQTPPAMIETIKRLVPNLQ